MEALENYRENFVRGRLGFYSNAIFKLRVNNPADINTLLDAAAILQASGSRASFVMLGGGLEVSRLKARANQMKLDNVLFLPPVPMSEVATLLAAADVLLVHLRKDPLFEITIPSKTQASPPTPAGDEIFSEIPDSISPLKSHSCQT